MDILFAIFGTQNKKILILQIEKKSTLGIWTVPCNRSQAAMWRLALTPRVTTCVNAQETERTRWAPCCSLCWRTGEQVAMPPNHTRPHGIGVSPPWAHVTTWAGMPTKLATHQRLVGARCRSRGRACGGHGEPCSSVLGRPCQQAHVVAWEWSRGSQA
jgi:hypothetical protein